MTTNQSEWRIQQCSVERLTMQMHTKTGRYDRKITAICLKAERLKELTTIGRNAQEACVNYTACQSKWDLWLNPAARVKTAWQCAPRSGKYGCVFSTQTERSSRLNCGKSLRDSPECVSRHQKRSGGEPERFNLHQTQEATAHNTLILQAHSLLPL